MTNSLRLAAVLALVAPMASAEAVAPAQVAYDDYGEVMTSLTGAPGDAERGAEVMTTRGLGNCIACHQVTDLDDHPFHGEVGPSLDGVAERWSEAQLRGIIANAKLTFPDSIMPAFYKVDEFVRPGNAFTGRAAEGALDPLLTAQQIEDVVAYLMTLDTYYD